MTPGRVVVIGAGVVGASCAYELALRGWSVEVVDLGAFGAGCSHGNCGYVCPSHVYPLAKPGAMRSTLPLLLKWNSPFRIGARVDVGLWKWFGSFARCATKERAADTAVALHALLTASKARYEAIIAEEGIECEYEQRGCLFVYERERSLAGFEGTNERIGERFGYCGTRLDGKQLAKMEPSLRDGLAGAWYFECDAHLRPDRYMSGLRRVLERRGVVIHEHRAATGMRVERGRATALETSAGEMRADAFVYATGAWTGQLWEQIGVRLPVVPGKGYSVTARRPGACPAYPMVFEEHRVAITPFASGYRIGSMMEFAGFDSSLKSGRIELLKRSAARYLRETEELREEQAWWGWRPMVPDGKPFIGMVPGRENVLVAAGHSMIGMSTGPATGQVAAEILSGEETHIEAGAFGVGRAM